MSDSNPLPPFSYFKVCINSETITIDRTYAETELGYLDGNISTQMHLYNASDVLLHANVVFEPYAVQISGGSTIKTFAEVHGGLIFRDHSRGVLTDGSRINGDISVRGGSSVEITGGAYWGDVSVDGIGSQIIVSGGSFIGGWFIGALSALFLHGCDFIIEDNNLVQGFLKDGTPLDVAVKANGLLYFVDECPDVIGGLEEQLGVVFSVRQFGFLYVLDTRKSHVLVCYLLIRHQTLARCSPKMHLLLLQLSLCLTSTHLL
jgi:hypothetical protein